MKKTLYIFLTIIVFGSNINEQEKEYLLKSAFIEKFVRYTVWPEENKISEFRIYVYGESPIYEALQKLSRRMKIKKLPIVLKTIDSPDEINDCQVLFVPEISEHLLEKIIQKTIKLPVLTVSDHPGYCEKGIHINLFLSEEGNIKFQVNVRRIKQSGLSADMYLLGLGELIY